MPTPFRFLRSRLLRFLCLGLLAMLLVVTACSRQVPKGQSSSLPALPETVLTAENSWAFNPETDTFDEDALLDLRELNETVAGETGFIQRSQDGRDFVKGDGSPIRFWAINTEVWHNSPDDMAIQARFLAKRGVNMVRWHGQIVAQGEQTSLNDIDENARDQLWHLVAAMKQEGIYTTLSPYYAAVLELRSQWPIPRDGDNLMGHLFFDDTLQTAYKSWLRALLEPVNPYTGIALKDEPAVALFQLQNEDSLLFWTLQNLKGADLELLNQKFGDWLIDKYGSLDTALQTWKGNTLEGDDVASGAIALYPIWEMTQEPNDEGARLRLADQTQFLTETMRNFNAEMVTFLRDELGVQQLINAGNWKTADPELLNDAERYSYTAADVIAVNRYYGGHHEGENSNWAVHHDQRFTDPSVLVQPDQFPLNLKQVAEYTMMVTESSWVPPISHQSEGPFLVSAFQSLTGIDGFYWFAMREPQWRPPSSANGYWPSLGKWVVGTPELLGNFPAAALMYRRGYIQQGEAIIQEHRSLKSLWQRERPVISEARTFDPNRDTGTPGQALSDAQQALAFLTGPVEVSYGDESGQTQAMDLAPYVDETAKTVTSVTGEISWDYDRGLCQLDSPKAQGVTGFLNRQETFELSDVTITSNNDYGAVSIVSMDGEDLTDSQSVLVQVGTTARSTNWQQKETQWTDENEVAHQGYEIVSYGEAPWRIANAEVTVTLENSQVKTATVLDMNGMKREEIALERDGDVVTLQFPKDSKYVVLQ